MSKTGKRLLASALEARKIAKGEVEPAQVYVPAEIDVKGIRNKLKLSQDDFASQFGFSLSQVRDWEQNRHRPIGGVRAYLLLIERKPNAVMELLAESMRQGCEESFQEETITAKAM